jgi:hypothetical protein
VQTYFLFLFGRSATGDGLLALYFLGLTFVGVNSSSMGNRSAPLIDVPMLLAISASLSL